MTKTFNIHTDTNQLKGLDAATIVIVTDPHGIIWETEVVNRDQFDSSREYHKAIEAKRQELKQLWPSE